MVHAVLDQVQPGEVLILTMPEPEPIALIGELLATQAQFRQVAAILVDASVRDTEELQAAGLPIWAAGYVCVARPKRCVERSMSRLW